jgi:hypothetical protein
MTTPQCYHPSLKYHDRVDQLEQIARSYDPEAPDMVRSQIIEILGELGIWPNGCFTGSDEGPVVLNT